MDRAFEGKIDYMMLQKIHGLDPTEDQKRYGPAKCIGTETIVVTGTRARHVSTSYVERQDLTMRMNIRWSTRLTNAFSKKVENLAAAITLHFLHYNYPRPHKTLTKARNGYPRRRRWRLA